MTPEEIEHMLEVGKMAPDFDHEKHWEEAHVKQMAFIDAFTQNIWKGLTGQLGQTLENYTATIKSQNAELRIFHMLEGYVRKGTLTEEILQKYMKELFDLRQAAAADVRAKIEALRQQQATAKDEKPAEQTVNG